MKVNLYTPIFKEGVELDGQIVYATNERDGLREMQLFFDADDLEGVEVLGWTTTDDPDYESYMEFR
jgi:hypothetical protein